MITRNPHPDAPNADLAAQSASQIDALVRQVERLRFEISVRDALLAEARPVMDKLSTLEVTTCGDVMDVSSGVPYCTPGQLLAHLTDWSEREPYEEMGG